MAGCIYPVRLLFLVCFSPPSGVWEFHLFFYLWIDVCKFISRDVILNVMTIPWGRRPSGAFDISASLIKMMNLSLLHFLLYIAQPTRVCHPTPPHSSSKYYEITRDLYSLDSYWPPPPAIEITTNQWVFSFPFSLPCLLFFFSFSIRGDIRYRLVIIRPRAIWWCTAASQPNIFVNASVTCVYAVCMGVSPHMASL